MNPSEARLQRHAPETTKPRDQGAALAPQPPVRPDIDDCCRSGCTPCIFDLYEEAMERYRIELKAWQERHAQ